MGHCKADEIQDLKQVISEIQSWDKIKEKGFGKLYFKSKGFLHFHSKDGRRWADVRDGENWGAEIDIPLKATASQKKKFLSEVMKRYKNCLQ